jgi:hypothetical protein
MDDSSTGREAVLERFERKAGWFERFLPRSQSKAIFVFAMACYSIALGKLLDGLVIFCGLWPTAYDPVRHARRFAQPGIDESTITDFFIFPIVESFILIGLIELVRRLKFTSGIQVLVSTLLICFLHSLKYPIWGVLVAPGFLIDTASYVYWRRTSFWVATQIIIILHFCDNLLPLLTLIRRTLHS